MPVHVRETVLSRESLSVLGGAGGCSGPQRALGSLGAGIVIR